jgi:hypothetical protein
MMRVKSPDTSKRQDVGLAHDIDESTRSGNEDVATLVELSNLFTDRATAICDAGTKHGPIAQTTSLIEDLAAELASRSNNKNQRLSTDAVTVRVEAVGKVGTRSSKLLGLPHELGEDRDQECCSLAGTCDCVREGVDRRLDCYLPVWAVAIMS